MVLAVPIFTVIKYVFQMSHTKRVCEDNGAFTVNFKTCDLQ